MDKDRFTKVAQFQYSSEAYIFSGKLEAEGIKTFVRDNNLIDSDPLISNAIGGVKIFVNTEDVNRANKILTEINTFSFDDVGNLIKCPKCGSEKTQLFTTIKDIKSLLAFLTIIIAVALPIYVKYKYKCELCKHEFNKNTKT